MAKTYTIRVTDDRMVADFEHSSAVTGNATVEGLFKKIICDACCDARSAAAEVAKPSIEAPSMEAISVTIA